MVVPLSPNRRVYYLISTGHYNGSFRIYNLRYILNLVGERGQTHNCLYCFENKIHSSGGSGNNQDSLTRKHIKDIKWSYLQRHLERLAKCVKFLKLTGSQLLLENDTKASRDLWNSYSETQFLQLFEANEVTQIKGIKLDFFLSSQLTKTGVKEATAESGRGQKREGFKRCSDCGSESQ